MRNYFLLLAFIIFSPFKIIAQQAIADHPVYFFISDTQQPLFVEKIFRHSDHNELATQKLRTDILQKRPAQLFMLGDIVSLGYSATKWKSTDLFLDSAKQKNIKVTGILGNHELMGLSDKGASNFQKRFPEHNKTGYLVLADSMAFLMMNSNFRYLSKADNQKQKEWYQRRMEEMEKDSGIKHIIVCCHHAAYSNSKTVGSSMDVQKAFADVYQKTQKAKLFITGHAHAFEHFKIKGKEFIVIGGGGGMYQPLNKDQTSRKDIAQQYKPSFHYLSLQRKGNELAVDSYFLRNDFSGTDKGYSFLVH